MDKIIFNKEVLSSFVKQNRDTYPRKSFGYFLEKKGRPETSNKVVVDDFYIFSEDDRNEFEDEFMKFGNYYETNKNAGFIASQEEMWELEKKIRKENMKKIGVYHTHGRHPTIFSYVDAELHPDPNLFHLLISLRNPDKIQIQAFKMIGDKREEVDIITHH